MSDALLLTAASVLALTGAAHSYLGERYILTRLFRRGGLPPLFGRASFTRRTMRFAWHLTTVAWLGFAGLLAGLTATLGPTSEAGVRALVLWAVAATFGVHALASLVGSRGRHLSWVPFGVVSAIAIRLAW